MIGKSDCSGEEPRNKLAGIDNNIGPLLGTAVFGTQSSNAKCQSTKRCSLVEENGVSKDPLSNL